MISLVLALTGAIMAAIAARNHSRWDRRLKVKVYGAAIALASASLVALPDGYILQKLVARLVMPPGLIWITSLGCALLGVATRNRALTVACGLIWVAITLAGSSWVGGRMIFWLEDDFRDVRPFESQPFDAIMVLGGGTSKRHGYAQLASSGDRVLLGARLYHAGKTNVLITSGSSIPKMGGQHDSALTTAEIWMSLKVPKTAIVRISDPKNTIEEIRALKRLQTERGWTRVGLVTSAWHMRRATKLARAHDVKVVPLPADFRGDLDYEGILSFVPNPEGLTQTYRACWELLGAAVGR